jgi:hypothetical protein
MTRNSHPPLYGRVVALDREVHAGLRLKCASNLAFAAGLSAVPLLCAEFRDAAREYAIVFVRSADQGLMPAVLTGKPEGPNLYVDATGRWNAQYVPAYVRRYPFVTARTAPEQYAVCIDAECRGFDTAEGAQLFVGTGEPSPLLHHVVKNLADFQQHAQLTEAFTRRLQAAGVLIDADAKADLSDGRALALRGFCIVDEARLRDLPEATLREWLAGGELKLIHAHLLSLGNLLQLLARQRADESLSSDLPKSIQ